MNRHVQVLSIALALLAPAVAAHAVIVFGPNGSGGFNAYERVDVSANYATATANSAIPFPGAPAYGVPASVVIGHLATFNSSVEYEFLATQRAGAPNDVYIGLSDDPAFSAGAFENGNNSGGALPANGAIALAGQRGAGWAQVGQGLNTFHQRSPGVSIWGGGEPNDAGGEDAATIRGDGLLNDLPISANQSYLREWNLNLPAAPVFGPAPGTPGWIVTDIRNVGGVNNGNYKTIAAAPPGGAVIAFDVDPVINHGVNNGDFRNDNGFPELTPPQGFGDNYVLKFDGFIEVPVAGAYTLRMHQDDPLHITIGTNGAPVVFEDLGCCDFTNTTVILDAGIHPISVIFAEFGGGDHVELSAAFGANVTNLAQFRLLGDTANGGLAIFTSPAPTIPEPTTALLGALGMGLLSLRRRRAA